MKDTRTLTERLRGSYRSLAGIVVVSPTLLAEAADEIDRLNAELDKHK